MEALGAAASVMAVVDLATKVATLCMWYSKAIRNAQQDINRLQGRVNHLNWAACQLLCPHIQPVIYETLSGDPDFLLRWCGLLINASLNIFAMGDVATGEKYFHQAIWTTLGVLGEGIYMTKERWKESEELLAHIIGAHTRTKGHISPQVLESKVSLVITYWHQGRLAESENVALEIMQPLERILGAGNPMRLIFMAEQAKLWHALGR